ncbi:hypothetical protein [Streptomyces colonosanans]|uniref:Uncharacterized protein n=1 Tax=Streptomyces colonosanans TaxID=1428652 RepID=A0A1S2P2J4_9ACTN|nr:hypothetical protein [Streptomyces colonosanans]OIJ87901.1 hypothetical protein BIV24_24005 [Streptomyces colonosanans]
MNIRRISAALGAVTAAAVLGIALPTSTQAAEGVLIINDQVHVNPHGCFSLHHQVRPARVLNETTREAFVFAGYDCSGPIVRVVPEFRGAVIEFGHSLFVE